MAFPLSASTAGAQNNSGTSVVRFEVKVAIEKADPRLRPGMTATVNIITQEHPQVVLLPTEALGKDNKVTLVLGEKDKQARKEQTVKIGLRNATYVEVISGLKPDDRVEVVPVDAKDRRKIEFDGPN
jgi:multidrug efflux pump subunit AcrA (membrane-fusion protein)